MSSKSLDSTACMRPCKPLRKEVRRVSACAVARMYKASASHVDERAVACAVASAGEWGADINKLMIQMDEVRDKFSDESLDTLHDLLTSSKKLVVVQEVLESIREAIRQLRRFQRRHRFLRYVVKRLLQVNIIIKIVESMLGLSELFDVIQALLKGYSEYEKKWSCDKAVKCKGV